MPRLSVDLVLLLRVAERADSTWGFAERNLGDWRVVGGLLASRRCSAFRSWFGVVVRAGADSSHNSIILLDETSRSRAGTVCSFIG